MPLSDSLSKEYICRIISGFSVFLEKDILLDKNHAIEILKMDLEAVDSNNHFFLSLVGFKAVTPSAIGIIEKVNSNIRKLFDCLWHSCLTCGGETYVLSSRWRICLATV